MLSNLNQDDQKAEAQKLGASAYYVKSSLTPSQTIKHINEVINNKV
jgi:DNA-binding NarL/FixJ family response regulator